MNTLYSNNADIKYPLSDFHETDIPNDMLMDVSISVPEGLEVVLGIARVGLTFAFVSFEEKTTRDPIGSVLVSNPQLARVYPLDMDVAGFGWVVFGPRAAQGNSYYSGNVSVDLDPEVFTALKTTAPVIPVSVNGFPVNVQNVLRLLSGSEMLTITVQGNTVYFDRNDSVLTTEDRVSLTEQELGIEGINDSALFTLGGVGPDANGNVDVDITGCIQECLPTRELVIPRGNLSQGVSGELPLDSYQEPLYGPDHPCGEGEESSSEGSGELTVTDPFEGCTPIVKKDILDVTNGDKAIGTLYTVDQP